MNHIIDPTNNNIYNILSYEGKQLLKSYIRSYQLGGNATASTNGGNKEDEKTKWMKAALQHRMNEVKSIKELEEIRHGSIEYGLGKEWEKKHTQLVGTDWKSDEDEIREATRQELEYLKLPDYIKARMLIDKFGKNLTKIPRLRKGHPDRKKLKETLSIAIDSPMVKENQYISNLQEHWTGPHVKHKEPFTQRHYNEALIQLYDLYNTKHQDKLVRYQYNHKYINPRMLNSFEDTDSVLVGPLTIEDLYQQLVDVANEILRYYRIENNNERATYLKAKIKIMTTDESVIENKLFYMYDWINSLKEQVDMLSIPKFMKKSFTDKLDQIEEKYNELLETSE